MQKNERKVEEEKENRQEKEFEVIDEGERIGPKPIKMDEGKLAGINGEDDSL